MISDGDQRWNGELDDSGSFLLFFRLHLPHLIRTVDEMHAVDVADLVLEDARRSATIQH
jgi:hypothetical protein